MSMISPSLPGPRTGETPPEASCDADPRLRPDGFFIWVIATGGKEDWAEKEQDFTRWLDNPELPNRPSRRTEAPTSSRGVPSL